MKAEPFCKSNLKAKKTVGFISCIVISVYSLDTPPIKDVTEYSNNCIVINLHPNSESITNSRQD